MGMYDYQCGITGVSLTISEAVLVGLQPVGAGFRPITLGISGNYDRYGSIDGIKEDLNTTLVLSYFCDRLSSGDFLVARQFASWRELPPRVTEDLLAYLERNITVSSEESPAATLFGERIFYALILKEVWAAIATESPTAYAPTEFKQIFGESSPAEDIYRGHVPALAEQVRQLGAVDAFIRHRGLTWSPPDPDSGSQFDPDEYQEIIDAANQQFSDVPAVIAALTAYDVEIRDWLEDF